jgi:hypothetical protein
VFHLLPYNKSFSLISLKRNRVKDEVNMNEQSPNTVNQTTENKPSDKELNFRALEAKYQRELAAKEARVAELERMAQEKQKTSQDDEDEDDEPYVAPKKLEKKLNRFEQKSKQNTQEEIQRAIQAAREQERQEMWLEANPDFYDTLQNNAEKFAKRSPALAKSILNMPDNFERQKLVYQSIKELGLDKPETKQSSIQDKVDANRRSPYYQPSGVGTAPYNNASDFSPSGQKNAYQKMQELIANRKS